MSKFYSEIYEEKNINMDSAIESKWYSIERAILFAIKLQFSGAPTGTFAIEASMDKSDVVALSFPEGPVLAEGSADSHDIMITEFPYNFVRIKYTPTSGTGSLDYKVCWKGF